MTRTELQAIKETVEYFELMARALEVQNITADDIALWGEEYLKIQGDKYWNEHVQPARHETH